MHQQVQSYIDNLKVKLLDYKGKRPHLSWRAIAKHSGVNRYFLSKIVDDNGIASASKIFDINQLVLLHAFLYPNGEDLSVTSAPEQIATLLDDVNAELAQKQIQAN